MLSFGRVCGAATAAAVVIALAVPIAGQPPGAAAAYTRALEREGTVRAEMDAPSLSRAARLTRVRAMVTEYERLSKTYRTTGYADNALWQAATLSGDAFRQFGESVDRRTALRLLDDLAARFPSSSLITGITPYRTQLAAAVPRRTVPVPARPTAVATAARPAARPAAKPAATPAATTGATASRTAAATAVTSRGATLTGVQREVLAEAVRLTLTFDREVAFTSDRMAAPARVLVDLANATLAAGLKDGRYSYPDEVVRQVRVTRADAGTMRVQIDLTAIARVSIYPMYEPYRLVVDVERRPSAPTPVAGGRTTADDTARANAPASAGTSESVAVATTSEKPRAPAPAPAPPTRTTGPPAAASRAGTAAPTTAAPAAAAGRGGYSLSRQLGLGAARIVIDPGHGGHDPGAQAGGVDEAELVLDVALRLERLLLDTPGVEVVMTRRTGQYVPLEERTAIANRAGADLFLSIHANSSPNPSARGIETYFLNLATDADAQAVAARENATSGLTMRHLNDIVRTITFDDKRDESRDFAMRVQTSLYARLRKINRQAKSLGVKQAPFQVLVGATMPSVLAEISFLTNEHESALLKTDSYRDQIAAALHEGIMGYQRSLKGTTVRTSGRTGG